ncbi:MAG: hypothetical protein OSJ68_10555, partial [Clostridia bacterium]|nr:hypothetical protein [Clostridia bacterium]
VGLAVSAPFTLHNSAVAPDKLSVPPLIIRFLTETSSKFAFVSSERKQYPPLHQQRYGVSPRI